MKKTSLVRLIIALSLTLSLLRVPPILKISRSLFPNAPSRTASRAHGGLLPVLQRSSLARCWGSTSSEMTGQVSDIPGEKETKPKRPRGRPKGLKLSAEARAKIAEARRGKKWDEETRKKMAKSKVGRAHLPATIERMSQAQKGKRLANSTRAKIRKAREGQVHAPEVKERIRKSVTTTKRKKRLMQLTLDTFTATDSEEEEEMSLIDEIRILRIKMDPWIQQFKDVHNKLPTLENTRVLFPSLHTAMLRYRQLLKDVNEDVPDAGPGSKPGSSRSGRLI
ncbi:hypothetical protein AAMO2058_000626800 [Amorphochlora amoebiformis]